MIEKAALMRVLTDFAGLLVSDYQISDALHDLVDGVTRVLGVTGAGVSLADGDRITFATAASEPIAVLERLQEDTQLGPCVEAHRSGQAVLVADLADDAGRWPLLAETAAKVGMVAVAGVPMRLAGTRLGALNLYDAERRDWSDDDVGVARLLADMATGYVANASKRDQARRTTKQLQEALDSRVIIEQAKGIVAAERDISVDDAFTLLRTHARSHNVTLRSVADAVVNRKLRL